MFEHRSLGLSKVKPLPGHHRKRLAIESSRHHSRPDDSHMFIIKLPPNPYYYANTNTAYHDNGIEDKHQKVSVVDAANDFIVNEHTEKRNIKFDTQHTRAIKQDTFNQDCKGKNHAKLIDLY